MIKAGTKERREHARVERLIREQMQGTLGNEIKTANKRMAKIEKFRNTFRDKAFKSGKFKAAAEYAQQMARFDAMPRHFKEIATPPRPSQEAAQQMNTIRQRTNTAIRRDMKTDLAAIDKFQKRHRQYEHDLRLKHDKRYRPHREGIPSFFRRPEDREGFRTWSAQHDPEFHKRQQRFLKKYGEDPQKYISMITPYMDLGVRRGDLREEAAYSRQFINRAEYDKARRDAWNRYNQWKRKQPRTPYRPISSALTPEVMNKPIIDIMGKQATFVGPRPKQPTIQTIGLRPTPKVGPPIHTRHPPIKTRPQITRGEYTPSKPRRQRYNQAAYLAGLQSAPMTMGQKMNQGIYKPYANGGGVRKPKYNKKG
jgi:hypothetical protein